ncbi:hypothetical protein GCM10028778_22930 [Barrientosiimonas marina]|uniref:Uncharacterized protein n=1 Tax=Lentibacillus kimchii TaxID=1542911 RepID=A0ABW2UZ47_9BACI
MKEKIKAFAVTFLLGPSLLGLGVVITFDLIPILWTLITGGQGDLTFKEVLLDFLLGYVIYLIYTIYLTIRAKIKNEE